LSAAWKARVSARGGSAAIQRRIVAPRNPLSARVANHEASSQYLRDGKAVPKRSGVCSCHGV
jgi:hypothetical protein